MILQARWHQSTRATKFRRGALSALPLVAIFGLSGSRALADLPPPIPAEFLHNIPWRIFISLSPDGSRIAYMTRDNRLCVGAADQDAAKVAYTFADDVRGLRWQGDGENLLVLKCPAGNRRNTHVFQFNPESGMLRDLTPFRNLRVEDWYYKWETPDQMLVTWRPDERSTADVARIDLKTGAIETDTSNPGDTGETFGSSWLPDEKLETRACIAITTNGTTVVKVRKDRNSKWKPLLTFDRDEELPFLISFSEDGTRLRLVSSKNSATRRLVEVDLESGRAKVLAEHAEYDLWGCVKLKGNIRGVTYYDTRRHWIPLTEEFKADVARLTRALGEEFEICCTSKDDYVWIVTVPTACGNAYYHFDRRSGHTLKLFDDRPDLLAYQDALAPVRPVFFTARDGTRVTGYLTLPTGVPGRNLPAVILVHGGPQARDTSDMDSVAQWLANRGIVCLQVNYRGSFGFGKRFEKGARGSGWRNSLNDILDAKKWLVSQGTVDSSRVGIMGSSWGGHLVLCALAFSPDEFRLGIDLFGESSLVTHLQNYRPSWRFFLPVAQADLGGSIDDEQYLKNRSPLYFAHAVKAPLLIYHGARDEIVRMEESQQMVEALRTWHKPVKLISAATGGHEMPPGAHEFWQEAEWLLSSVLGGRYCNEKSLTRRSFVAPTDRPDSFNDAFANPDRP